MDRQGQINKLIAADADTLDEFVLTLPVRAGSRFHPSGSGPVIALIDGLDYQIRGSLDLTDFTEPVDEVFPALESGCPPLAPDWEYHSFRLISSNGVEENGFIRGVVEAAP
jgi:hypothetical protein